MSSIAKSVYDRVWHWYFVYELRTSLYMLEPWEKTTFSILFLIKQYSDFETNVCFLALVNSTGRKNYRIVWVFTRDDQHFNCHTLAIRLPIVLQLQPLIRSEHILVSLHIIWKTIIYLAHNSSEIVGHLYIKDQSFWVNICYSVVRQMCRCAHLLTNWH